ncbi:filamentous hemagglutinin N-terminal domain-containing protein [Arsenophonus apicola]|uniref:Filamentous hemagglutinin N-terminal domain-containing protein n=1 Tax=Arsenophonus apicola TaxID=2879119 RepID=A0ABY8P4B7_9GAMM|nr:filamentous hemagglutinin N-terminal domain-containing protein [Arsenophonus apicola]WGO83816.1 filamentous hemagglutinin N-terminal domain-containing protein [Arsenophonus apicola]
MNKLFYRLIFNVARQMVMVVADITTGYRTGPVGQTENSMEKATNSRLRWVIKSITTSLWLTFGMVSFKAQSSTIQADSNAPANQQPTIVNSQNGLPQINIQTPNRDGVSRNQYRQFDVDHKGAILNNSSTNVNTQLGGIIQGNDWLAKGQAKIILNEVNSRDPSQLNGFIEVAGKKADVIIANPAGITCNGCGFINADQALLSAGKTLIENGKIKGFAVDKGNINIAGKGYNGNDINYTALIARSVKINAKLHAKDLVITTGKNQLAADGKTILKTDHSAQDEPPEFALDVYALGGMYANRITMRGTEHGVGVRNAGHIAAQAGDISLSADGKITNVGAIIGNQHLAIKSQQMVANGGTLMAEQHINLTAKNAINNTEKGEIVAGENIVAHAEWINSDYGTLVAAGVDSKGKLTSTGSLMVKGQKTVALQGNIVAKQNIVLTGSAIDLSGSAIKAKAMILTATEANIDTKQANILVDNKALLTAKKGLDHQKGQLVANQIVLISPEFINNRQGKLIQQSRFDNRWHTRTLHNQQGEISLAGDTNIVVNELDNQSGRLLIRASKLDIDSQILNNQHGHLTATGKDATHIKANLLTGQQGGILTNGALKLKSQSINLDQATTQAKKIAIQGQNLSHQAGQMRQTGAETGQITLSETLNNQSGNISSQGDLTLNINKLENQQGTIITEKTASLSVVARQSIDNRQGSLIGEKNVFLNTLALTHDDGKLISNQADMLIQTQVLQGRRSNISSNGQLRLTATEVDLTEANTQADNIQFIVNSLNHNRASLTQLGEQQGSIQVAQQLTNRAGDISANGSFVIKAKQLDNLQGKLITKRGDLQLIINEDINNQAGLITAEQLLMMSNQALFNHQGHLQATNIDINTHQQQFDNSEGRLHALQKLTLHSGKLANLRGVIQSGSNMLIDTHGQQLSNSQTGDQQGIDAQGSLSIYSGVLKNQQGRIFARQQLNIDSQGLDNRQGLVLVSQTSS